MNPRKTRQKAKKRRVRCYEEAIKILNRKATYEFNLYNINGRPDPVPFEVWKNIIGRR